VNIPQVLYLQVEDMDGDRLFDDYAPLCLDGLTHCFESVNDSDIVYRREPKWTRVEDGLPTTDEWQEVVVRYGNNTRLIGRSYYQDDCWWRDDHQRYSDAPNENLGMVTHYRLYHAATLPPEAKA